MNFISPETRDILYNGLWKQNPGVVQLLGLCPLLAVSSTVVNALSLGLATTLVMAIASGSIAVIRNLIPAALRIPVFVLLIAVLVTAVTLVIQAYAQPLYQVLGIFLPLITTNCIVMARAEAFASKQPTGLAILDGISMGLGLTMVLVSLGAMREFFGQGTLFSGFDLALGAFAQSWTLTLIPDYAGFILAMLPPGAFIGLGLLIALYNRFATR